MLFWIIESSIFTFWYKLGKISIRKVPKMFDDFLVFSIIQRDKTERTKLFSSLWIRPMIFLAVFERLCPSLTVFNS